MSTELQVYDLEAAEIRQAGLELASQAEALVITDDETDAAAKVVLAIVTKGLKAAKDRQAELRAPAAAVCDAIDSAFDTATGPFKTAKTLIASKTGDYCTAKERAKEATRREEERLEREQKAERAKLAAEAAAKGEEVVLEPQPRPVAVDVPKTPAVVRTAAGNVGMVKHRGYRIVDESQIPDEYWLLDAKRIAAEYRAGDDVPGCEEEITYTPRTR